VYIADRLRFRETGAPVPDGTEVQIRRISDNLLIGTTTTNDGYFNIEVDGYPGAVRYVATIGSETLEHTSLSTGPARGVQIGEFDELLSPLRAGIVEGIDGELQVTPGASGLTVNIAAGAFVAGAMVYRQYGIASRTFAPVAPHSAELNTYHVFVRIHGKTSATPWVTELLVNNYPDDAEPAPPAGAEDYPIAAVRIAPGATSLTAGDITNTTARANDITTDDIAGFDEAVWAAIRDKVLVGSGLTKTIDETADTITIAPTTSGVVDAEAVQDIVAAFIATAGGITKTYDDTANTLTLSAVGSGSGSFVWKDTNFNYSGGITGTKTLGSASISLPAGTYVVESQVHFSAYGNGTGAINVKLTGNGTPQSPDQSSRNFDVSSAWREILLTGRRRITLTATTTLTATATAAPVSGATVSAGSGVVFIKSNRES
jgi:hypothetical protein